jgi:hypothetical protein
MLRAKSKKTDSASMMETLEPRRLFSAVGAGTTPLLTAAPPANTGLSVVMGSQGIAKLTYDGDVLFDGSVNPMDQLSIMDYDLATGGQTTHTWVGGIQPISTWNAASDTLTVPFTWGTVAVKYTVAKTSVEMAITVTNKSQETLEGLNIMPLALRFPTIPVGFSTSPEASFNSTGPGITVADFGTGVVALVEEDGSLPLSSGFLSDSTSIQSNRFETWFGSDAQPSLPAFWPCVPNPIAPNAAATYHISLRFGAEGSTAETLAPDVMSAYMAANPYTVNWTDRSPIGMLMPAGSGASGRSATNPRGWFNDPTVNVFTQAGLASFAQRLLAYAAASVDVLKSMGAQGMITWDIEGEQYAQPTTYIGDPQMATTLAPELAYDDVIDKYFATFRNAGFAVGVTVRPQEFEYNNGNPYQLTLTDPAQIVQTLVSKISYAEQQWGCTLFYIDSTDSNDAGSILEQVHKQCPGVLLIPENPNVTGDSSSAPYETIGKGQFSAPASVLQVYSKAFSVIDTGSADPATCEAQLLAGVEAGNILLFRGWYNDPANQVIKSIYQQAAAAQSKPAVKPAVKPAAKPAVKPVVKPVVKTVIEIR